MKIVKEKDSSIKFEFLGKKYDIRYLETWEINDKDYEVTYIIINEDSELDEDDKFYEYFSSKKTKDITQNILLEFWINNLLSDKPLVLDEVSYPFTMFSFVRIDDHLLSRFSFPIQAYKDLPSLWLNSSTVEYFVK